MGDTTGAWTDSGTTRRAFTRRALLGGGALLAAAGLPRSQASAAGEADALLLSCIDYRLVDKTERYMAGRGLRGKYDQVILAGASLGVLAEKYPAWATTFWDHLDLALQLHAIRQVLVLDHRDCGAYQLIFGEDFAKTPDKEKAVHAAKLRELGARVRRRHAKLRVELLLMSLDGAVEVIT